MLMTWNREESFNYLSSPNCKGTVSRVVLSKSSKLVFTKALYLFIITFPLFLASSVCIMQCGAFYSIFRTICDYRSVPCACVPDHLL